MTVKVVSYKDDLNEYGEKKQVIDKITETEMRVYVYSQTNKSDPRYVECDYIGLIRDNFITVNDDIEFNNLSCNVKYIIPSPRYTQIFMRVKP